MLWVPAKGGFEFSVTNQATPSLTPGTAVTPGNNTFPTYTEILSDASVTEDCYAIFIRITGISATGLAKNALVNIGADPAGGTSFSTIIPNLFASCAATALGTTPTFGVDYYFPLYIKAGTALAAQVSVNNATVGTSRIFVKLMGKPQYPDRVKFGYSVESFGEVTASSKGTDVTPGNTGAEGAWVQLGSNTTKDYFWWQLGAGITNTTVTNLCYHFDLGRGDGSNKDVIIHDEMYITGTNEALVAPISSPLDYEHYTPTGTGIYGRGTCSSTTGTSWSMIGYGMPV